MEIKQIDINRLRPYEGNARIHDDVQLEVIASSIKEFGFIAPAVVDENNMILVGHGRIEAAKMAGLTEVPCVCATDLTEEQKKAYILADNLLTERGGWDYAMLQSELSEIEIDMSTFGFEELEENINNFDFEEVDEDIIICPKCGYEFYEDENDV